MIPKRWELRARHGDDSGVQAPRHAARRLGNLLQGESLGQHSPSPGRKRSFPGATTGRGSVHEARTLSGAVAVNAGFDRSDVWPGAGDSGRADAALGRWRSAAARLASDEDRAFAEGLPSTPAGRAMLECVFGASPFLESCLLAEPGFVRTLWSEGPDRCFETILTELGSLRSDANEDDAGRTLRIARRRAALTIALADISGVWELESVTGALSDLADTACSTAFRLLLTKLAARGVLTPPDPEDPEAGSGLIALGLGKLGGRELNYSSDIDLILLFEPDAVPARKGEDIERHLVRLARRFVALLSERTADGYAFRVDLRLRPDPSATPLVVSATAARHYYRERGRTWERAALIKARPIAADTAAARAFLNDIAGFVWRRNLDFATVQELHDIKRQIDAQHGGGRIEAHGHDLKLGRGGIREIEFFAQTHQLTWGGKDRRLRVIPTCEVLRVLSDIRRIPERVAKGFISAYRFLRRAEHRVQMTRDEQTHSLPEDPESFRVLARFLGYPDDESFVSDLVLNLQEVEQYYTELYEIPLEVTAGGAPDPKAEETLARLGRLGFANPAAATEVLGRWKQAPYPVVRDPRSRELLDSLTPALLTAMLGTVEPDLALERFDHLLSCLPDGLQMFSLFQANLHVMEHVAEMMVCAPAIAERVAERPALFQALLESEADGVVPNRTGLEEDLDRNLESCVEDEDWLFRLRAWVEAVELRILAHTLFRRIDPLDEPALRNCAIDCALGVLLARSVDAFRSGHGRLGAADCALLVVDRPGARNSSIVSDRNLVLIHDAPEQAVSDGETPLPASAYYEGLLRHLVELGGGEGGHESEHPEFPSSAGAGAVRWAIGLPAFERYLNQDPSSSLRMALVRTRVAAGGEDIARRVRETVRSALSAPRHSREVSAVAVTGVETRTEDYWHALHHRGGLADLENLVQSLQVRGAPVHPELADCNTGDAIALLEDAGLLSAADGRVLHDTWRLGTGIRALRGLVSEDVEMEDVPAGLHSRFAAAADISDFPELGKRLLRAEAEVREILGRHCA